MKERGQNLQAKQPEHSSRRVIVFTGPRLRASTAEVIEAIAKRYPRWSILVLQNSRQQRILPYVRRKLRRLFREPVSYPLEILHERISKLKFRRGRTPVEHRIAEPTQDNMPDNVSFKNVAFHDGSACNEARAFDPWLGIALSSPILRKELFQVPQLGTVNLHKSLLPEYRGMPAGFWEMYDGAEQTGVTVHWVAEGLDTGDIVTQVRSEIPPYSTPDGIGYQLDQIAIDVVLQALEKLNSRTAPRKPQGTPKTPTRSRPTFLQHRTLCRRFRLRRTPCRTGRQKLREAMKCSILFLYVYLYAPIRNLYRALRGQANVAVLLYHRVDDNFRDDVTVGVEQFARQVELLKNKYDIIDLSDLLKSRNLPRRRTAVAITFDDGYASNHLAAMLLRRKGLPATFFISTALMESDRPFPHDREKLGKRVTPLNWDQIRQMNAWNFRIAPHTLHHANIGKISTEEAIDEITGSMEQLDEKLGPGNWMPWFAFPYGKKDDITEQVREKLPYLGLECCLSAYGGTNSPEFNHFDIKRQGVDWKYSDLAFLAGIEGWIVRT